MFLVTDILDRYSGIARGTLIQQFGFTRKELAMATRAGTITRVRPGVFALPHADAKVVTAAAHGGALTCAGALRAWGIWVLPDESGEVHVWMGGAGRRHKHDRCSCITHYSPGTAGPGLAPVASALIHFYRCHDQESFFAAYESAWNQHLINARERAQIRGELPVSARWLLDLARPDADSGLESLVRLRLHLLGLRLDSQVDIDGVGRVDFVIGGRVILEADGKLNHAGKQRHKDLVRDAAASALGYETLRFDYAMIVHNWETVIAAILSALARSRA